MPGLQEAYRDFKMNACGCIFEYCGKIPENVYQVKLTDSFNSPLEEAVYRNDVPYFKQLVQEGHKVSVKLKIGKMSCIEYASMMDYREILRALLEHSMNANILQEYFALEDVVERAYKISHNKHVFFDQDGLAEANRYEAALYTAIEYNHPKCVELLLQFFGQVEPRKHNFFVNNNTQQSLGAKELAQTRGHTQCYEMLCRGLKAQADQPN